MPSDDSESKIFKMILFSEISVFIIALVIILIFGIMLWQHFPDNDDIAQGLFTGFMAWIGAIIGFYFGQKPIREIITRIEEKNKYALEKKHVADKALSEGYEASDFIEELINEIKELKRNSKN